MKSSGPDARLTKLRAQMRRILIIVVAILAVGVLAWEFFAFCQGTDLSSVDCPEGRPRSVSCEAFGHREYADNAASLLPYEPNVWFVVSDPFDGQPITVRVPIGGRESPFGRELNRHQYQFLAVIAVLPDGRRVGKVVEIPVRRVCREVSVTLP
jgi:hypothetical protein